MSAFNDPAFYALAVGFGLQLFVLSPLVRRDEDGNIEGGCIFIISGIAIIAVTTAVKVLS